MKHLVLSNLLLLVSFCFNALPGMAQSFGPSVEGWRCMLPYNQVNDMSCDGEVFYCATTSGFFTYNRVDGEMTAYSKANGMHDVGLSAVGYDPQSKSVLLAYANSNMDIFKAGSFSNLPDLKLAQVNGDKTIYNVVAANGMGYVSTGVGLLVINFEKREIKETINFFEGSTAVPVYATLVQDNTIYAATGAGLFTTSLDNINIQNYASWEHVDQSVFKHLTAFDNHVYAAVADSIFVLQADNLEFFQKTIYPISRLDGSSAGLWISALDRDIAKNGYGKLIDASGQMLDSFSCIAPSRIAQLDNGEVWFTENSNYRDAAHHGLRKRISVTESEPYFPSGPVSVSSFDISVRDGDAWVAHGGKDQIGNSTNNRDMFSHVNDGYWQNYPWVSDNINVQDFIRILKDWNTGKMYAASYYGGLLVMETDGSWQVYNEGYLPGYFGNPGVFMVSGLALDDRGNLWISNFGASNELSVMTPGGEWYQGRSIPENTGNPAHSAADVIIDDYDQKWFIAPAGGGAIVYDDNQTPETNQDDRYRVLRKGENSGNLPDNNTLSIVKDLDGAIWIGTTNGIGIVQCPDQVIDRACEATLKVVQQDQFAGHLFYEQAVYALAVDAANRKWVGTANGVWLLSEDGEQTVYRFTAENSPLPANRIIRINIDPVRGDVYFSTEKGIAVFRSTATEGRSTHDNPLLVYPNPVPAGFEGMIAVRGVADGSDVRFTDISGQLVYRTTAFGGQAVWNGQDYTGRKVQSGVYLVFVVSKDGTQKATTKLIVHE